MSRFSQYVQSQHIPRGRPLVQKLAVAGLLRLKQIEMLESRQYPPQKREDDKRGVTFTSLYNSNHHPCPFTKLAQAFDVADSSAPSQWAAPPWDLSSVYDLVKKNAAKSEMEPERLKAGKQGSFDNIDEHGQTSGLAN